METSTTTATDTPVYSEAAYSYELSAAPIPTISEGEILICALLMVQISITILGGVFKTLIGIKSKWKVYD